MSGGILGSPPATKKFRVYGIWQNGQTKTVYLHSIADADSVANQWFLTEGAYHVEIEDVSESGPIVRGTIYCR